MPDEIFQAAQECLKENCQCGGSRVRNKHNALLGGILRCGHCDSPMTHARERQRLLKLLVQRVTYTGESGEIAVSFHLRSSSYGGHLIGRG